MIDALGFDRALTQGDLHRPQQLVAVERNAAAVALNDDKLAQLHPLEGRETKTAGKAHAAAAYDRAIFRGVVKSLTWVSRLAQFGQRITGF